MFDKQKQKALVDQAKALFIQFTKSQIVQVFIKAGLKMVGISGSAWTLIAGVIAKYFWNFLYYLKIKNDEKIETKKELDQYDEKINNPTATPEDIKKAGKDFLSN